MAQDIAARLEYLRGEIRAERISYGELHELQGLAAHIAPGDVELLEWAGVPEGYTPAAPGSARDAAVAAYVAKHGGTDWDAHDALDELMGSIHVQAGTLPEALWRKGFCAPSDSQDMASRLIRGV